MARTTAPLFSLDASGTLANAVVFSKWRGRQYVRRHTRPKNPQTPAQLGMRSMLSFLTKEWASALNVSPTPWIIPAANDNVSPINSYVKMNMANWRLNIPPTVDGVIDTGALTNAITMVLTGGQRNVLVSVTPANDTDTWSIAIFRSTNVIVTVNWNLCVAVIPVDGTNARLWTDAPLPAGTYHYRAQALGLNSQRGTACADQSASAT